MLLRSVKKVLTCCEILKWQKRWCRQGEGAEEFSITSNILNYLKLRPVDLEEQHPDREVICSDEITGASTAAAGEALWFETAYYDIKVSSTRRIPFPAGCAALSGVISRGCSKWYRELGRRWAGCWSRVFLQKSGAYSETRR